MDFSAIFEVFLSIFIIFANPNGVLAQLVERQVRNLEVRSSILLCSTKEAVTRQLQPLFFVF